MKRKNRYSAIIEHIFNSKYGEGLREIEFLREELTVVARKLRIKLPKNLGDLIYCFRYRADLPEAIRKHASTGETWIIRPAGTGKYRFVLVPDKPLLPNAKTDELYVGVDKKGAHYIFPIQAKGGSDKLSVVQIEQDFAVCKNKFHSLICRPIGAQFISNDIIALFEFEQGSSGVSIRAIP